MKSDIPNYKHSNRDYTIWTMRLIRLLNKYLVITILLMTIFAGAQQNAEVETYLQKPLQLQYEFSYSRSEALTTNLGTLDNITTDNFVVEVGDPLKDNSSLVIKYNNQSYIVDDALAAEELGLQVGQNPIEFGFIALTSWNIVAQIVDQLETNNRKMIMNSSSELVVSTIPVESYVIMMADEKENQSISLHYEANSGILLSGEIASALEGLHLRLLSIDGNNTWFDRFNIHSSSSSGDVPVAFFLVGFLAITVLLPLSLYFVRSKNKSGKKILKSPGLRGISSNKGKINIFGHADIEHNNKTEHTDRLPVDQGFINVAGYGRIRVCCNQTARLNEQYCPCGRSIPQKLRDLYNKWH